MTTTDLINYYANLLILQFRSQPKAYATIQTLATPTVMPQVTIQEIDFSSDPNSGAVTLLYGTSPIVINWNDSTPTIQTNFQAVSGLGAVTVSGTVSSKSLVVTFTGVTPPAAILTVSTNTLSAISGAVAVTVTEIDVTLPLAVQNAFNVTATEATGPEAVGVQLDVIGKYVGVSRTSRGFTTQITLNDHDFTSLIQLAIIQNNAGSSTFEIVNLLNQFFPNEVFMFDHQDMTIDYYVQSTIGSQDLVQVFITEGLLPRPMAVRIRALIYFSNVNIFFGFRTYKALAFKGTPFNTYQTGFNPTWKWLSYKDAIII